MANSLNGNGELHDIPFFGTLPASCTTVTATDTKEVQLLSNNSNVSVDGTGTTTSLSPVYGTAQTLEFTYNPGDTVSTKTIGAGLASVSGNNTNSMAFMEISNNANPYASGASIYFEGSVTSGEDIFADATTNSPDQHGHPGRPLQHHGGRRHLRLCLRQPGSFRGRRRADPDDVLQHQWQPADASGRCHRQPGSGGLYRRQRRASGIA